MQGLGGVRAERDGGYAEHVTVAADVLAPLPAEPDSVQFAAIGLAGVTAIESSEDLDGRALGVATRELLALRLPTPPVTVVPLAEAARAHTLLEQRSVHGRVVLVP
jgi:NADPH:quinone reductase-like Zn-dependent oxidoreductase